jgi:hypothetical protein
MLVGNNWQTRGRGAMEEEEEEEEEEGRFDELVW